MGAGRLEPSAGEGEERLTIGRKARPPRVFTMPEPEKGRKWRERGGGGGGRGKMKGLGQLMALSACLMAGSKKKRKINGGCRKRRGCSRWKHEMNSLHCEISQAVKFRNQRNSACCKNFATWEISWQKKNTPCPLQHLQNRKPKIVRKK